MKKKYVIRIGKNTKRVTYKQYKRIKAIKKSMKYKVLERIKKLLKK